MAQNRGSADRFKWETRKTALGWLWELYDREEDMLLIGRSPAFYPSQQSCHQNAWFHKIAPLPPIETMHDTSPELQLDEETIRFDIDVIEARKR